MRALVCVLRHEGVRLRDPDRWSAGHLRTETEGGVRRLVLRDLARRDETGVLRALYRPRLASIDGDILYFHGWSRWKRTTNAPPPSPRNGRCDVLGVHRHPSPVHLLPLTRLNRNSAGRPGNSGSAKLLERRREVLAFRAT